MSTYMINFKQLRQLPDFLEMLAALERGFKKFHVDFYLVGAVARDVLDEPDIVYHVRRIKVSIAIIIETADIA